MNILSMFAPVFAARTASAIGKTIASTAASGTSATGAMAQASDKVTISPEGRAALEMSQAKAAAAASADASVDPAVEARLAAIKSKDAMSRTDADREYLLANDKKLAEISEKERQTPGSLTASEIDYMQKAGGFVNTFAMLSPAEKALYDKAVASGNKDAADGISQIAFIRMGSNHMAGGANGSTYDPINTEITAANVEKYFRNSIVAPSGQSDTKFQALMQFMQNHSVAA
jgi:hypothetical protein